MISRELLVQARYFHLVFWAAFSIAAAVMWWGVTYSSQPGVFVVIGGIMVYIALRGVYDTWRTMTEFEPDEPRGDPAIDESLRRMQAARDHMDEVFKDERQPERPNPTEPQG